MLLMSEAGAVIVTVTLRPLAVLSVCRRRLEVGDGEAVALVFVVVTVTETSGASGAKLGPDAAGAGAVDTTPRLPCTKSIQIWSPGVMNGMTVQHTRFTLCSRQVAHLLSC